MKAAGLWSVAERRPDPPFFTGRKAWRRAASSRCRPRMRERRVGGRSKEDERRQLRQFREGEAVPEEAELNLGVVEGGKEIKNLALLSLFDLFYHSFVFV